MEVPHAVIYVFQIIKFVIMSRKERLCPIAVFMYVLHDRAGDGHSVVGGSASSDLVEKHEGTRRNVVEDHRGLEHLHHEGRLSAGNVVRSTDAGEYLVAVADAGLCGRNERTYLGHKDYEGRLPQEGGLTGHVRTRENNDLLGLIVEIYIIRNELLPCLHHGLDHRMTACLDVDDLALVHLRAAVAVAYREVGKSGEHIKSRKDAAVLLDGGYVGLNRGNQLSIYL